MNTMNTTTSSYLFLNSDHYMAAAKWIRGIEGTGKVTNIEVHPLYTAIAINESRILRSKELANLGKLCEASGLEYSIMPSAHGMIIIIGKA
jgi:hypothetical protein